MSADFSSVGLLDVVSTTPAQPSVGKVTIQATLSRLAMNKCEICGLMINRLCEGEKIRGSMSVCAYVLIDTAPGKSREVAKKIGEIPGISAAYPVTGPYDVIAAVDIKHKENATKIVLPAIQTVAGVTKTITCLREDLD